MSENGKVEMLLQLLERLPGRPWATHNAPVTLKPTWLYMSPRIGDLYGITDEEFRDEPLGLLKRLVPEDGARLAHDLEVSLTTLAPLHWTGRAILADGAIRWIETHGVFERATDGGVLAYGQSFDVSEKKQLEHMHRTVIDQLPTGVHVLDASGQFLINNPAAERYAGRTQTEHDGDLSHAYGIFKTDGVTPLSHDELPLVRALAGEETIDEEMIVRTASLDGDCWVRVKGMPLRDVNGQLIAGMTAFHDITTQRRLERELRTRNEELAASEEAKTRLIERLRYSIGELSNPILEIWDDVLVMPIIGVVDSRRTADMVQRLLTEVARTQASFVIVDLTGVEIVDTRTADHLIKLMRKVELVGARCVLTGIRPAVAETLVDIGVDFGRVTTLRNLKHGLRAALRHGRREREGIREANGDDDTLEEAQAPTGRRPRQRTS